MFRVSVIQAAVYKYILFKRQLHALLFLSNCLTCHRGARWWLTSKHAHVMDLLRRENLIPRPIEQRVDHLQGACWDVCCHLRLWRSSPNHSIWYMDTSPFLMPGSERKLPAEGLVLKHDETKIRPPWDPLFSSDREFLAREIEKNLLFYWLFAALRSAIYRDVTHVKLIKINFHGQIVIFLEPDCRNGIISTIYL